MLSLHEKIETTFIDVLAQCMGEPAINMAITACVKSAAIYTLALHPKHAQFINDLVEFWSV